jgi:hypothetical protein
MSAAMFEPFTAEGLHGNQSSQKKKNVGKKSPRANSPSTTRHEQISLEPQMSRVTEVSPIQNHLSSWIKKEFIFLIKKNSVIRGGKPLAHKATSHPDLRV